MSPVEGSKSTDQSSFERITPIEPNSEQRFLDINLTSALISCNASDAEGKVIVEKGKENIKLLKLLEGGSVKREYLGRSISFAGHEIAYVQYIDPQTNILTEWSFSINPGNSQHLEQVSEILTQNPNPIQPLEEETTIGETNNSKEKPKLLNKAKLTVRHVAEYIVKHREKALRDLENS